MNQIEEKLNDLFTKTVTAKLPDSGKSILVKAMPWLALVGGVLSLLGAWGLFQLATFANQWTNVANELSTSYGYGVTTQNVSWLIWVSLVVIVVEAVMLLAAFSPLKNHKKLGWDLVYWTSLINVVYAVLYIFVDFNFFSLLFSLLASAIGLYLLFQIRSYYLGGSAAPKKSGK
ncbi:MAG TPA: hypothetical protein VLA77_04170 [Candidatus Saccharimonadales bacterium]|nr:hypothetical protein [Candidatus Saccharimonadales bacterium]